VTECSYRGQFVSSSGVERKYQSQRENEDDEDDDDSEG
jgi:hypothetical protein